jgi:hypothetical protein
VPFHGPNALHGGVSKSERPTTSNPQISLIPLIREITRLVSGISCFALPADFQKNPDLVLRNWPEICQIVAA